MTSEEHEARARIVAELPHLRRYARALMRGKEQADDLVQDTLERALHKWEGWQRKGSIRSWLFSIQYRMFLDHCTYRNRPAEVGVAADIDDRESVVPLSHAPQQEQRMLLSRTMEAMADLPPDQRSVIALVTLDGLDYDAVSSIMDIPIGTVRSRLYRARESLRRTLLDQDGSKGELDAALAVMEPPKDERCPKLRSIKQ